MAGVWVSEEALAAAGTAYMAALERATAETPTGDPRHADVDEVVAATVAAAGPLVVACELRWLAEELAVRRREDFERSRGQREQRPGGYSAGAAYGGWRARLECGQWLSARARELERGSV